MRFLSVCSGIEAASLAWAPLGWSAVAFSEIDAFPRAVLKHHYPNVPLHGDFTTIEAGDYDAVDLIVGGTPCQSFSVAGLRKGLADERGNLTLEFIRLAQRLRPRWIVWENVPGVLSQDGGRAFGAFLGGLAECGYGFAYRVLDAQYFGVPQRRRRVFVVGYFGDWRRAAAVLFERHSLQGHPPPSREKGEEFASFTPGSIGGYKEGLGTIRSSGGDIGGGSEMLITSTGNTSHCLNAGGMRRQDYETETLIAFNNRQDPCVSNLISNPIGSKDNGLGVAIGVTLRGRDGGATAELGDEISNALRASVGGGDKQHVMVKKYVRRLTPRECERLQGFPDNYTLIPLRNAKGLPNGKWSKDCPRYKALGNSMAVPVMRWIGERIAAVERITDAE